MATEATRVNHVVVDSGAFIRNAPLQAIGVNIITIQDVVSEIKDKATKERLQVLPYQLNFREPSQESIKLVTEFCKKTGDYPSLSAVDLRVLALTYQLEKEHVGTDHIKTVPDTKITWTATKGHLENPADIAGFYLGKKKTPSRSSKSSECSSTSQMTEEVCSALVDVSVTPKTTEEPDIVSVNFEQDSTDIVSTECDFPAISSAETTVDQSTTEGKPVAPPTCPATMSWASVVKQPTVTDPCTVDTMDTAPEADKDVDNTLDVNNQELKVSGKAHDAETCSESRDSVNNSHDLSAENISPSAAEDAARFLREGDTLLTEDLESEEEDDDEEDDDEEEEEDDEDDEDGWITPSNIKQVKASMGDVNSEPARVQVGCLTTDFAMQNVLIQMGLNVVSVDGMLIKRAKNYVLRCYGCYKVSTNIMREFCHHCGNKTLQKVSMTVNDDGSIKYFLSRRRVVNTRGTKFSLPMPKGGKHSTNPVLCEDQQAAHQRTSRRAKVKYDVLDPNYNMYTSPFAPIDTQSRSAQLGIRDFKHAFANKRNPNENKKVYGRRK